MQATPVIDSTLDDATRKPRSAPLDPQIADRLLDLLSSNDDFRGLFQASPQAALRSIGYVPAAANGTVAGLAFSSRPEPFSFCEVGHLASKQAIQDARATLKEALVQGLAYNTPTLDAVNLPDRPRLR